MAREREEDADPKVGGDTVMVGGMDNLVKDKANEVVIVEDDRPAKTVARRERDEDDEDARLAYDDSGDDYEERRSRRQRRNRSQANASTASTQKIAELEAQVGRLTGMITSMGQSQVGLTIQGIDTRIADAQQALKLADAELERAISEGDGARFREVNQLRDEANARLFQLSGAKQRLVEQARRPVVPMAGGGRPQPQPQSGLNERAQNFTEKFMSRFSYFDPDSADEDSLIIKAVDDAVAAEGYRPDTPLYWRELEKRLAKKGYYPESSRQRDDGDDDDRPPRRNDDYRPESSERRYRPTSGGNNNRRGTGTTFRLEPDMRAYLESEGILQADGLTDEQKAKRNRLISGWRDAARRAKRGEFNRT